MKPTNFAISHSVAIYVMILMVVIGGLGAYVAMPREAAPDVTIPVVVVSTPYYGVTPSDIETLVTQPMEKYLKDLKDLDKMNSTSSEGVSIVTLTFEPTIEVEDALQKTREKVDKARPELPPDAEDPVLTEINFSEFPIMLVNLHGDTDPLQLKELAEDMQDELESVPGVLSVNLAGGVEREVRVLIDPDKLQYYKLSLNDVSLALQREHVNLPGGSIDVGKMKFLVRVDGEFKDSSPLDNLVIKDKAGQPIYLHDIGEVVDGYKERDTYSRFRGQPNVSLSIQKRAGENLLRITEDSKEILSRWRQKLPTGVNITVTADVSDNVYEQVQDLENNILTGMLLVFIVLLFFMGGIRNSLFVATAIPLSMLISFLILHAMDITLNMVVLFSLVLALGMLVDNAIVIVENIYRHASQGKPRSQAARDAVAEVGWPVISSTATTVAAFGPMMFWPGVMGQFMGYLPLTVIVVLSSSLLVALIINPVLCATLMRIKPGVNLGDEEVPDNLLYRAYRATLEFSLRRRWVVVALSFVALFGTFAAYGVLGHGVEFFPQSTPTRAFIKVRSPDGTNLDASNHLAGEVESDLSKLKNLKNYVVNVGVGGGGSDLSPGSTQPNRSQFTLEFPDADDQAESPFVTLERIRDILSEKAGGDFEVEKESSGPPAGKPINIEISGADFHELGRIARGVRQTIKDVPGLTDLKDNYVVGRPELQVVVNRKQAALLGVGTNQIANTVRTAVNGNTAIKLRDGDDEIDVVVRLQPSSRDDLEDIRELTVVGREGAQIPLREVAELTTAGGTGSIRRVDRDRVITVEANVEAGFLPNDVLKAVQLKLADHRLPPGYQIRYTGENEEQVEAQIFLGKALLAALFLITLVLVTQFNSLLQPLVIVASVFLSLIGVLWGLILTGTPFGVIMVGIGIISLAGVVVNNAIVLIDYINQLRERGIERDEAVLTAGLVRFRPVMLTAVTTILGLVPMVFGVSWNFSDMSPVIGGRSVEMWGPMARSVASGLLVATVLTLVVVPVMYTHADDIGEFFRRMWEKLGEGSQQEVTKEGSGAAQGSRHGGRAVTARTEAVSQDENSGLEGA
jgi:CzcA family heavy metal efflux pump